MKIHITKKTQEIWWIHFGGIFFGKKIYSFLAMLIVMYSTIFWNLIEKIKNPQKLTSLTIENVRKSNYFDRNTVSENDFALTDYLSPNKRKLLEDS